MLTLLGELRSVVACHRWAAYLGGGSLVAALASQAAVPAYRLGMAAAPLGILAAVVLLYVSLALSGALALVIPVAWARGLTDEHRRGTPRRLSARVKAVAVCLWLGAVALYAALGVYYAWNRLVQPWRLAASTFTFTVQIYLLVFTVLTGLACVVSRERNRRVRRGTGVS